MKKGILFLLLLFCTVQPILAQKGRAVLKVVVDKDGKISVFDIRDEQQVTATTSKRSGKAIGEHILNADDPQAIAAAKALLETGNLQSGGSVAGQMQEAGAKSQGELLPDGSQPSAEPGSVRLASAQTAGDRGESGATLSLGNSVVSGFALPANDLASGPVVAASGLDLIQSGGVSGGAGSPNLTLSEASFTWAFESCTLTFNETIINETDGDAGAFEIGYYLSQDTNIEPSDIRVERRAMEALAGGTSVANETVVDLSLFTSEMLPNGSYYVGWIIDPENDIEEANEDDNEFIGMVDGQEGAINLNCVGAMPNLTFDFDRTSWELRVRDDEFRLELDTRVINSGTEEAGSSRLAYFLSADTVISDADCLLGDDDVKSLDPGEHSSENIKVDLCEAACEPGVWYVGWICDADQEVEESNEEDNTAVSAAEGATTGERTSIPVFCPGKLSNLTLDPDSTNWTFDSGSCTLDLKTRVINTGVSIAGSSRLGYFLSTDIEIDTTDSRIGEAQLAAIPVASFHDTTFSASFDTLVGVPEFEQHGVFYLGWIVDYKEQVPEADEGDNHFISTAPIQCLDPNASPNLTLDLGNSSWFFDASTCTVQMRSRVINSGTATSGTSRLGYYLSEDTSIERIHDSRIGEDFVEALTASGFSDETFAADLTTVSGVPAFDPHGVFYLGWIVDYKDEVAESNEGDNRFVSNRTVNCPAPTGPNLAFDFSRTTWEFNPQSRVLRLKARVTNLGDLPAASSELGYYLSDDPEISTADCFIGDDGVSQLAPGAHDDETFSRILCNASCGEGTWYIGWICDFKDEVEESDETDNTAISSADGDSGGEPATIALDCTDPNLTLDLDNTDWQFAPGTCLLEIRTRVVNAGNQLAGSSRLGYYLSEDSRIRTTDHRIGQDNVGELDIGEVSNETFSADLNTVTGIPEFDRHGAFYLGWIVDYRDQVVESDEDDNRAHSENTLTCGLPNLVIDGNATTATFDAETCTLEVATRVLNEGVQAAVGSRLGYYLSEDRNITTADSRIGDDSVTPLAPGEGDAESLTVNLSTVVARPVFDVSQSQYIGLISDYRDEVVESNEDDNTAVFEPAIDVNCPTDNGSIQPLAPDAVACGAEFYLPIIVGDPVQVTDLFGVSFDLDYPTEFVNFVSAQLTGPVGSSPNLLGDDLIFFNNVDDAAGKVSVGLSRKSGGGVTGSGPVVWFRFTSSADIPDFIDAIWSLTNVAATDENGARLRLLPANDTTRVECNLCVVWPGDANNDGIVTAADVLPLGVHFGRTGPERSGASLSWTPQTVTCWDPERATFADGDGNGRVSSADVLPIGLNFGKTHSAPTPRPDLTSAANHFGKQASSTFDAAGIAQTPTIQAEVSGTSGDTIVVNILVSEVTELFGVAFDLVYGTDNDAISALSVEADPFFGNDLIFLPTINTASKTVSVGMSRKPGQGGVTGGGVVATAFFGGFEAVTEKTVVTFTLSNPAANDPIGETISLTIADSDSLIIDPVSSVRELGGQVPESFALLQNYPNPFNPETAIDFQIPRDSRVVLTIYDILGNQVRTLVDEQKSAGRYQAVWDGRDNAGRLLSSGIYIYKLEAGGHASVKKMSFVK